MFSARLLGWRTPDAGSEGSLLGLTVLRDTVSSPEKGCRGGWSVCPPADAVFSLTVPRGLGSRWAGQ